MPIYEYRCPTCGNQTELIRKSTDTNKPLCEECNSRMEKALSAPNFRLIGNGWAKDHYGLKKQKGGK